MRAHYTFSSDPRSFHVEARLTVHGFPVIIRASATRQDVRAAINRIRALQDRGVIAVQAAGFFDDVAKFAKRALKSKVFKSATQILSNPMVSMAISAAIPGGVALQPAIQAVTQASSFVSALDAGAPKAKAMARQLRSRAASGDVRATGALALARRVRALKREGRAPLAVLERLPKATVRALRPEVVPVDIDDEPSEAIRWPDDDGYDPPFAGEATRIRPGYAWELYRRMMGRQVRPQLAA